MTISPIPGYTLDEAATAAAAERVRAANPHLLVRVARPGDFDHDTVYEGGVLVLPVAVFQGPVVEMTWLGSGPRALSHSVVTAEGDVLAVTR
ncbi:MAG TPA: hypothetical protein VFY44_03305 [Thermoleophilaceae bacterium]|nr:hypothetical protein [Thermoleophilaceae bacterium]